MRGDTAFTMMKYLDGWDRSGVRFVFGMMANRADRLADASPNPAEGAG